MSGIWLGSNIWAWCIAEASSESTFVLRFIEPLGYEFKATLLQQLLAFGSRVSRSRRLTSNTACLRASTPGRESLWCAAQVQGIGPDSKPDIRQV